MKKSFLFSFFFFLFWNGIIGQGILPMNRYFSVRTPLNLITQTSSFGYSLRRLSTSYTGFAVELRKDVPGPDPEANVAFDINNVVSGNSIVTITSAGDGFIVGQTTTLSAFIGVSQVFVTTWYNQGSALFNANQGTNTNQPRLILNSAGSANDKPSISFDGVNDFLFINQPVENILALGIRGSFMVAIRPTANSAHFTFGYVSPAGWRWSFHVNWSDGNCYFDAAETCCAANRSFGNSGNINLWKQYSFVRGTTYKTVRISGVPTSLNNSPAASTTQTGGDFRIGSTANNPNATFTGFMSELLMFPTDLSLVDLANIENNQIAYWNL